MTLLKSTTDTIASLAGLDENHSLTALRARRPAALTHAQRSHDVLLSDPLPDSQTHFVRVERYAIAAFTAALHRDNTALAEYQRALLQHEAPAKLGWVDALETLAERALAARVQGPWGVYPSGPLSPEDDPGPAFTLQPQERGIFGKHLAAALEHTHLLVFHPRDASAGALAGLQDNGWTTQGIVTLSQLVSFLAFQLRMAHGLRILASTLKD